MESTAHDTSVMRPRNMGFDIVGIAPMLTKRVLVFSVLLLSGCQRRSMPGPAGDEPAFREPTATEVFNLRSKCAEQSGTPSGTSKTKAEKWGVPIQ